MLGVQKIGRYEVLTPGVGGHGSGVPGARYRTRGFERQVVVKTLDLSNTDDDEAFVTMFLDEARLVGEFITSTSRRSTRSAAMKTVATTSSWTTSKGDRQVVFERGTEGRPPLRSRRADRLSCVASGARLRAQSTLRQTARR